jgi:hypothetical protein
VTAGLPVLALALTARRVGVAAIDERLRLLVAETWYLRRHRSPTARAGLVRTRLGRHLGLICPAVLAVAVALPWASTSPVDPLCSTIEDVAQGCGFKAHAVVLPEVCAALDWSVQSSELAERLIGQFPVLETRIGCLRARNVRTDQARNARPLLRAAATAYAIAAQHLIHHE